MGNVSAAVISCLSRICDAGKVLLSAVQITRALIIERLRFLEIGIGIRKLSHPYGFVEGADVFPNMAR